MQKTDKKKLKNVKKGCSDCPAHGICLAETDEPEYFCPRDKLEHKPEKSLWD